MKTLKIKGSIPVVILNGGYYKLRRRVSRVTETVIVTVDNERSETFYRRDDGLPKSRERSGLAAIGTPTITGASIAALEKFVAERGTISERPKLDIYGKPVVDENGNKVMEPCYVYDSGFRKKYNSRGEQVYDYPNCSSEYNTQLQWLNALGFKCELLDGVDYDTNVNL